jgi:hypothetical protein
MLNNITRMEKQAMNLSVGDAKSLYVCLSAVSTNLFQCVASVICALCFMYMCQNKDSYLCSLLYVHVSEPGQLPVLSALCTCVRTRTVTCALCFMYMCQNQDSYLCSLLYVHVSEQGQLPVLSALCTCARTRTVICALCFMYMCQNKDIRSHIF